MKWEKVKGKENFTDISVVRFISTKTVLHDATSFINKYPGRIHDLEYLDETEHFSANSELQQDFKEMNVYLNDLYHNMTHDVKDAGHLWIAFTDKFNAFRERVLAASRPSLDIDKVVEQLREQNPHEGNAHYYGWQQCCDKLSELLNKSK